MSKQTRAVSPKFSSLASMMAIVAAATVLFAAAPAMAQDAASAQTPTAQATAQATAQTPAQTPAPTSGESEGGAPTITVEDSTQAPQQAQPSGIAAVLGNPLVMIILLFAIFYFMMIRPQQRKEKERQKMISELRAGRKVSFAGGLIGTIKEAKEQTFVIEICPGSTVEVARGAVMAAADEPAAEPAKK